MELNKIYCESNLDTMARMPDNFIDLTVTSPPYDNLRTYNGYCFDFENVAKELFRVTKTRWCSCLGCFRRYNKRKRNRNKF